MTRKAGEAQKWIKSQPWWVQFKRNFEAQKPLDFPTMTELLQKSFQEPIASAFYWDRTPEGFDYWKQIDKSFLDFYYGTESNNG